MTKPALKFGCTPGKWTRMVTKAALEAGLDPVKVLAGAKDRAHATVRWAVWRHLVEAGYSYYSIGKVSGFDHTSVMHAIRAKRPPRSGGNPFAYLNATKTRRSLGLQARAA